VSTLGEERTVALWSLIGQLISSLRPRCFHSLPLIRRSFEASWSGAVRPSDQVLARAECQNISRDPDRVKALIRPRGNSIGLTNSFSGPSTTWIHSIPKRRCRTGPLRRRIGQNREDSQDISFLGAEEDLHRIREKLSNSKLATNPRHPGERHINSSMLKVNGVGRSINEKRRYDFTSGYPAHGHFPETLTSHSRYLQSRGCRLRTRARHGSPASALKH